MNYNDFLAANAYRPSTIVRYREILSRLEAHFHDLATITPAELLSFVNQPTWGNSYRYMALSASKSYLRWRYGNTHPALIARIKRHPSSVQRHLTREQVGDLLRSFDISTSKGARDYAIAAIALDTGLRASELCNLDQANVDLARQELSVIVKGGGLGRGVFSKNTAHAIENWLRYRKSIAAPQMRALFVNTRHGTRLTRDGLKVIVRRWGEKIGVRLSPHDLRRTFAILTIQNGAPTRVVQLGGRWANIQMVELYTRALEQDAIRPYLPMEHVDNFP